MVHPEVVAESSAQSGSQSTPSGENACAGSVFLEKVSDIPVVNVAKEYGTAAYNQVKQMNRFTNLTLSTAESTLLYFALTAKPFLSKIQPQAKLVDDMACRGLEVMEAKAPFILKTPEELVGEARKLCAVTLQTGFQKVDEVKSMGTDALSSVKNYGLNKANEALVGTEKLVDRYLPPTSDEAAEKNETQSISERATQLTTKVTHRVYGHSLKHFLQVQKISQDSITKLAYTVELLQHIKENYAGKTMQECVDETKLNANWMWEELNKEPSEAADADKSLEQRMLSLARRITSGLVYTYSAAAPLTDIPQTCMDSVRAASNYAAELFTQFDQATNTGEVAVGLLQRARSTISTLEGVVRNIIDNVQAKESIEMEELAPARSSISQAAGTEDTTPKS